jgi:O-antigen ligase
MRINQYNLYRDIALLLMLCNMLYWVFPFPPVIWRVALVILAVYIIIVDEKQRLSFENAVFIFVLFNVLHFFVSYLWITPSTSQIGNILCAMLSLSLFIDLAYRGVMTDKFISIAGCLIVIVAVIQYYHMRQSIIVTMGYSEDMDITNNATSSFLMLLPMVFLFKNNIQKWAVLMICVFFLLLGAKRGNILAAIIPIGLFVSYTFLNNRHSVFKSILIIAVIVGAGFITYHWTVDNDYLMHRIENTIEGSSSGRDQIYTDAWHTWHNSYSYIVYLFGYGFDGTLHHLDGGVRAHNDWLEILVDYGLIGVLIYLSVFVTFVSLILKMRSIDKRIVLIASLFIWIFKSLYSMGFTEESFSILMMSMGTVIGTYKINNKVHA